MIFQVRNMNTLSYHQDIKTMRRELGANAMWKEEKLIIIFVATKSCFYNIFYNPKVYY